MKRLFLLIICAYSFSAFSYDRKFDPNFFEISPSSANDLGSISAVSIFNDDLSLICDGRVYECNVDNKQYEIKGISSCVENRDLTALQIDGQFCETNQSGTKVIYYSSNGVLYKVSMKNAEWKNPEELKIEGYKPERQMEEGSSFATKRWGFKPKSKQKEKMYNPFFYGSRLYFSSSELPGGKGGSDIWYITRNPDGVTWSAPVNYEEVNSEDDDDFPRFLSDSIFYFSSNRGDKFRGFNIYKKRLKKGDKSITLVSNGFNSNADDKNFVVVRNTPFFLSNRQGSMKLFRPHMKAIESTPNAVDPISAPLLQQKENMCIFRPEFDNKRLAAHYDDQFEVIYQFIQAHPNNRFEVVGYCDEEGSADHNVSVSLNRASVVMDKLIDMGVNEDNISYRGEGNRFPIMINPQTEEEFRWNRRIEIIKK